MNRYSIALKSADFFGVVKPHSNQIESVKQKPFLM